MSVVFADCPTCHGSGKIMGGDEYHDCPACRLRAKLHQRYQAVAEDSAEQEWQRLRDAGADELTLRFMAGDR